MRLPKRLRSCLRSSAMRDHSLCPRTRGSSRDSSRRQRGVGRHRVGERWGVAAVVLRTGGREAVAEAAELLRVDGIDAEAALHQALHHQPVRHLDRQGDGVWWGSGQFEQPSGHRREPFAAMIEDQLPDLAAAPSDTRT